MLAPEKKENTEHCRVLPSYKGSMNKSLCLRIEVLCTAFVAGSKLHYALEQISNLPEETTVKCFGT